MANYWKPTTPEQIADFKARRKVINKASKERIKLRDMGLLDAPLKIGRPPKMTDEQRKARAAERQRVNRAKAREGKPDRRYRAVKLDEPKPVRPARKLPIRRKEKPEPKRMKDRPEDPAKVRIELKPGFSIYTYPDADLDEKRAKYGIAI